MGKLGSVVTSVAFYFFVGIAGAQDSFEPPGWAYPLMDEGRGRGPDNGILLSVPGSNLQRTQTQIDDPFNPPDWYPEEHPPLPEVVVYGRPPNVRACGQCHMLHGTPRVCNDGWAVGQLCDSADARLQKWHQD